MKYFKIYAMMLALTIGMAACSEDDDLTSDSGSTTEETTGGSSASTSTTNSDLTSLTVAVDSTDLAEDETIPSDDEDYVENNEASNTIYITYDGTSASYTGSVDGVTVSVSGADVVVTQTVEGMNYVLSGTTTDGSFKMDASSKKKFQLTLNGVSITNSDGPAINLQSGKRAYVVANSGTYNSFADGTSYASSDEDQKGTIFSEGQLVFSGAGHIKVDANTKAGIASDDYILIRPNTNIYVNASAGNGLKSNDYIEVRGGVLNVETSATAAKGLSTDGYYKQSGGRVVAITSGDAEYDEDDDDVSGASSIKADSTFTISGGELYVKSTGAGGKGISTDMTANFNGGTVKVITTGKTYTYSSDLDSKAKGIKADEDLYITDGTIMVKATGGDGSEGIEAKGTMTISGGDTQVYSYDDAFNSAGDLTISGGSIYAFSTGNDGIDSNGNITISDGTVVAYGTTSPEAGIDVNSEENYKLYINGGTVFGVGGTTSYPDASSTQPSIIYGGSVSSGSTLNIVSGSTTVASYEMGRSYSGSVTFLLSAPGLTKGSSYTLTSGSTTLATISSLSSPYSTAGSTSGGMGGGGRPGGR